MFRKYKVEILSLLAFALVIFASVPEASAWCGRTRIFGGCRSNTCFGNSCATRSAFGYSNYFQTNSGFGTCSTCNGFSSCTSNACTASACDVGKYAVEPVAAPEPCEPCKAVQAVETPRPCEPASAEPPADNVEEETVEEVAEPTCEPCGAVKAVETSASCKTCEQNCATCPIKTAAKTALKVASSPIRVAVSELSKANELRARYGLPALKFDAALDAGCLSHSRAMSSAWCGWRGTRGALYHAAGYNEIVAQNWGFGVDDALFQWEHSDKGHREILLNPYFTRAGVGCFRDASGRNWCTMRFQ